MNVHTHKIAEEPAKPNAKGECDRCREKDKQMEEYKSKYLRALADYQNYEKRIQTQKEEWMKTANKELVLRLLLFLDDLDRAELFVSDPNLKLIKGSFERMLEKEGLQEIPVLGKPYDPHTAEVIEIVLGKQDDIVTEVLRKGYTLSGQIIRVAQVKVSKKSEGTKK